MLERKLTTIDNPILKEACRLFWICKGQIAPCMYYEEPVKDIYNAYFRRIWGWDPNDVLHREQGFEEAYDNFLANWPEA